jgi:hypothetical protein
LLTQLGSSVPGPRRRSRKGRHHIARSSTALLLFPVPLPLTFILLSSEQRSPTNFGRPNWDRTFQGIVDQHPDTDCGVFFVRSRLASSFSALPDQLKSLPLSLASVRSPRAFKAAPHHEQQVHDPGRNEVFLRQGELLIEATRFWTGGAGEGGVCLLIGLIDTHSFGFDSKEGEKEKALWNEEKISR